MAGSGFDLGERFREGLQSVGEGLVEVDRRWKALFGLLPNAGVVSADDAGNYTADKSNRNSSERFGPRDEVRGINENFKPGWILIDGTTLSRSGDEPITLISGDSVIAARVREIMITLQRVDTEEKNSDGASPLGALLDIAEAGGRVDIKKIGERDIAVLSRFGLGKTSRSLQSDGYYVPPFPIPFVDSSFIVDRDVVAVVKSGVMVDSKRGIVLRNPQRPERHQVFEIIGQIWAQEATRLEKELPPHRILNYEPSAVLSQIGNNPIELRQWYANARGEGENNWQWGFPRLTEQQVSSINERFGPLSEQLPSEQVRSIALRLEILVPMSFYALFSNMYDHIVEGKDLYRETALSIEAMGLGKTFYQGSSKPETQLGIQFEKGVVEVLLAGARWFHNGNDPFLGMTNLERYPNP